ncbi:hypothetical protein D1872_303980 [compost metagenome]
MLIKITEKARKLYGTFCPYSTEKCSSFSELDYKIQRCIDLGKEMTVTHNNVHLIQYYHLQFHVLHNQIINLVRTDYCYHIPEILKIKHYYNTYKVVAILHKAWHLDVED